MKLLIIYFCSFLLFHLSKVQMSYLKDNVFYKCKENTVFSQDPPSSGHASPTTRASPAPTLEVPENNMADSGASSLRPRSSTVGTAEGEVMKRELQGKQPNGSLSASNSQQQLTSVTPPNGQQKTSPMMNM
jgi:hypothetical protein